ncbi:hypothetical protein FAZ19_09690 [Sphingobacterium alkalisoli]|uniref:Uncharacterized protein n=1 Tax=Sphingobacterium alkalisoli TaxID=1874115 RepID=A0A4U0H519_9SPHI|nr:hypothetical protein [Sphingobacterium alkalisoli]TJY65412.1 hypothetical protein FAZ19_09690 [Sphingobacterium alkalisoli]
MSEGFEPSLWSYALPLSYPDQPGAGFEPATLALFPLQLSTLPVYCILPNQHYPAIQKQETGTPYPVERFLCATGHISCVQL